MASIYEWQTLLANITEYTSIGTSGNIVIEIRDVKHDDWEKLPGMLHEFVNQNPRYVKESQPIVNLTLKLCCRCTSHADKTSESVNTSEESKPLERMMTPEELTDFKDWFVNHGFEYP